MTCTESGVRRREFVGLVAAGFAPAWTPRPQFVERWSWAMGQAVHLMVFAGSEQQGLDACAAALAELRRVESRLSLFEDASDLCELNRHAGRGPMHVDHDLRVILARSAALRLEGATARLPNAHTQLDFGGIGVGYGIDRALAVLRARGITRAFIDVSGDCAAIGSPPGEPGWLVEVADPSREGGSIAATRLRDAALATSGNTARRHVLNPATGRPADALCQASVVTVDATTADALSTAMLVSGRHPAAVLRAYAV